VVTTIIVRSIILKKQDRGEADELVVFLSRDLGWLRGIAKNAKRSRIRFGGHLEPLSIVDLTLRPRKKDDLVWIDESQVIDGNLGLRSHIGKVAGASYFMELASVFLPENQPDTRLFDFLADFLKVLESSEPSLLELLIKELSLLSLLGFGPRFDTCVVCGKEIPPGEDVVFSPHMGGTSHISCAGQPQADHTRLSPETVAITRRALHVGEKSARRLKLSHKSAKELRTALSSFVRFYRGEDIQSLIFLEKLGQ
jgi:DNA repair protein RecO (recombination protein O)